MKLNFEDMEPSEILWSDPYARVVRMRSRSDGTTALLKTATSRGAARLRREAARLARRDLGTVMAVLDFEDQGGVTRLWTADRGGRALTGWLEAGAMSPETVLDVLDQAARQLRVLHEAGIIHQGLCLSRLLWDDVGLQIIDLSGEGETSTSALAYLSPEQTGRMEHRLDGRADLYALGAIAWHLLLGRPPFEVGDGLALVHAHLTQPPEVPAVLDSAIPQPLSAIVLRLMAKQPSDRYPSAAALQADLLRCRAILAGTAQPDGAHFSLPTQLIGREASSALLSEVGARVADGERSMVVVIGAAGSGRTALLAEAASLMPSDALLAYGRFSDAANATPHEGVIQALEAALHTLMQREDVDPIRALLSNELGDVGGLLVPLLPELGLVLEADTASQTVMDDATRRDRLMFAFGALVRAMASLCPPLILVLDDLDLADATSMALIRYLATDPFCEGRLLVGAWSTPDGMVPPALELLQEQVERSGSGFQLIETTPLSLDSIQAVLAQGSQCSIAEIEPISTLLMTHTHGNPQALLRAVTLLRKQGLPQHIAGRWVWSVPVVESVLANALVGSVAQLAPESQRMLRVAACLGRQTQVAEIAAILGIDVAEATRRLQPILQLGVLSQDSKEIGVVDSRLMVEARSRRSPEARPALHLKVGRFLLQRMPQPTRRDLLEIVRHLSWGMAEMTPTERIRFADLALQAGTYLTGLAATAEALEIFQAGREALSETGWRDHPETCLALCTGAAHAGVGGG
ncbi:MAG: hypothetical protein ACI8RZ_002576, partial [Myxococcota bacterium]